MINLTSDLADKQRTASQSPRSPTIETCLKKKHKSNIPLKECTSKNNDKYANLCYCCLVETTLQYPNKNIYISGDGRFKALL